MPAVGRSGGLPGLHGEAGMLVHDGHLDINGGRLGGQFGGGGSVVGIGAGRAGGERWVDAGLATIRPENTGGRAWGS